jgi:hypothetical protein
MCLRRVVKAASNSRTSLGAAKKSFEDLKPYRARLRGA